MKKGLKYTLLLMLTLFLLSTCRTKPGTANAKTVSYKGNNYDVYTAAYPKEKIMLFWKDDQGKKLKSLDNLRSYVSSKGQTLVFATNGGMFMENNAPLGLYIENGKELAHINLSLKGKGNFYLQPNGVFQLTDSAAKVVTTENFKPYKEKLKYATQSGPMLVVDGVINKALISGSTNTNIRSGVGITDDGKVVFAISDEKVNFYDFAALFLENLKCKNALFLDGAICRMYVPEMDRNDVGGDFGVMIGIVK
jgi:uncharacterized protein YigE (DUF2233 family)